MNSRATPFVVGAMVFLGAFLSFSMEPMVGRMITPYFGGAVHLWTISLMVFQALLLIAYLYAHLIAPRIGSWHLALLALPLLQWPLHFVSEFAPKAPTLTLIEQLLLQVSLPFAVLCTTAVVAQTWWHHSRQENGLARREPFFLYAISNWGAMVALFSYPLLIEPWLGLNTQRWAWSVAYLVYAATTVCAWFGLAPKRLNTATVASPPIAKRQWIRWLMLSAAPSALLLGTTNVVAMEIGSFPMVWVLPLALYLGSFILAFHQGRAARWADAASPFVLEVGLIAMVLGHLSGGGLRVLPPLFIAFFLLCYLAHRALYQSRPQPGKLSVYYLGIALGGWVGGLAVSLIAPHVFNGLHEYAVAIVLIVALCWPANWAVWWKNAHRLKGYTRLVLLGGGAIILLIQASSNPPTHAMRNFYGTYRIVDSAATPGTPAHRKLVHGKTIHGIQLLNAEMQHEPVAYYFTGGALEKSMSVREKNGHTAVIGLGAGNALPWFSAQEKVTLYEIDPDVETLARQWFSFLKNARAQTTVEIGDARLRIQNAAASTRYNAILVDAFSGDGIPIHLLTLEAIDVYLSKLEHDGVLVFHISNRYYNLLPVLKAAARARGIYALSHPVENAEPGSLNISPKVVVLSRETTRLQTLLDSAWFDMRRRESIADIAPWTDDHINVLSTLARP